MDCRNRMCIYWSDDTCVLDKIVLDEQGSCLDCVYIDIEEEQLKEFRSRSLRSIESR